MIAGNEGDVLGLAERLKPPPHLVEFVWQADLGEVAGNHDVIGGMVRKVLYHCRQHGSEVFVTSPEVPGQVAEKAFVGKIERAVRPRLAQMEIGEMGETENGFHELRSWMQEVITTPVPKAVNLLADEVRKRHGHSVEAILMYGSCLRSGDPYDGLVDFYVLVGDYTSAYDRNWLAWANQLLPPNVFYHEMEHEGRIVRTKYAVISREDFARGMTEWFHSYLWGRFAQPCRLVFGRDESQKDWVVDVLLQASARFVAETVPMLPVCFDWRLLWQTGLRLSYRAELRTEQADRRAQELVTHASDYFRPMTSPLVASLSYPFRVEEGVRFCLEIPATARFRVKAAWGLRRVQGKAVSLLRLIKSLFTFQGGVDYILWKLERHTGRRIDVSPQVRRHPLIYGWGVLWKLYREGVFR